MPKNFTNESFWSRALPEPNSGCWLWMGKVGKNKYGVVGYGGAYQYAHRVAWAISHDGKIPTLHVCHRCDNPSCVNPDHLFLGTPAENGRDRDLKGRHRFIAHPGESHGMARLTAGDVIEIRKTYSAGETSQRELAKRYGMSKAAICHVLSRRNWASV